MRRKLHILSHLLKKFLIENFIFVQYGVLLMVQNQQFIYYDKTLIW